MRSLRLVNRNRVNRNLAPKPHLGRRVLRIQHPQLMRSPRLVLRKKLPNPRNVLVNSKLATTNGYNQSCLANKKE